MNRTILAAWALGLLLAAAILLPSAGATQAEGGWSCPAGTYLSFVDYPSSSNVNGDTYTVPPIPAITLIAIKAGTPHHVFGDGSSSIAGNTYRTPDGKDISHVDVCKTSVTTTTVGSTTTTTSTTVPVTTTTTTPTTTTTSTSSTTTTTTTTPTTTSTTTTTPVTTTTPTTTTTVPVTTTTHVDTTTSTTTTVTPTTTTTIETTTTTTTTTLPNTTTTHASTTTSPTTTIPCEGDDCLADTGSDTRELLAIVVCLVGLGGCLWALSFLRRRETV